MYEYSTMYFPYVITLNLFFIGYNFSSAISTDHIICCLDRFWIGARIWYSHFIRKRHNIQRKCWVSSILNDFIYRLIIFREYFLFAFIKEFEKKFYMTVVLKNSLKNLSSFLIKCWTIGTFWKLLICTLFITPNFELFSDTLDFQEKKDL